MTSTFVVIITIFCSAIRVCYSNSRSPLSATFATLTSSTGSDSNLSFCILCTMPVSFSSTNMSSGPKNAILVVLFKPVSTIRSSFRSGSLSVGPPIAARAPSIIDYWTKWLAIYITKRCRRKISSSCSNRRFVGIIRSDRVRMVFCCICCIIYRDASSDGNR